MSEYLNDSEEQAHAAKLNVMRVRHEAARKITMEQHEAALQVLKEELLSSIRAMELKQSQEMNVIFQKNEKEILAAMQEWETMIAARRVFHEAPDDVLELIVLQCSHVDTDESSMGDLNVLRLVNKRCLQVVESVATRLMDKMDEESETSLLPAALLERCKRIKHIACEYIESLEGCPPRLTSLKICDGGELLRNLEPLSACKDLEALVIRAGMFNDLAQVSDLSILLSCTRLKKLDLGFSSVTDLSPLSSMPLLQELRLIKTSGQPSIKDISPLSLCKELTILDLRGNTYIQDLSPLRCCRDLEELDVSGASLVKDLSLLQKGFANLRILDICRLTVADLSPLTNLRSLERLRCYGIPLTASLLPLAECHKLTRINCHDNARDLDALKQQTRIYLSITHGTHGH